MSVKIQQTWLIYPILIQYLSTKNIPKRPSGWWFPFILCKLDRNDPSRKKNWKRTSAVSGKKYEPSQKKNWNVQILVWNPGHFITKPHTKALPVPMPPPRARPATWSQWWDTPVIEIASLSLSLLLLLILYVDRWWINIYIVVYVYIMVYIHYYIYISIYI